MCANSSLPPPARARRLRCGGWIKAKMKRRSAIVFGFLVNANTVILIATGPTSENRIRVRMKDADEKTHLMSRVTVVRTACSD